MRSSHASSPGESVRSDSSASSRENASTATALPQEIALRGIRLRHGNTGDHAIVPRFLTVAGRSCSAAEFQSQVEEPGYEPVDRLLLEHGDAVIGHGRLLYRQMHFGAITLPAVEVADVVVLPEYEPQKLLGVLVQSLERVARSEHAMIAVVRTPDPTVFVEQGWSLRGRQPYTIAAARDVLSKLREMRRREEESHRFPGQRPSEEPAGIRLFRQIELEALIRLYSAQRAASWSCYARDHHYWNWLVGRRGFERIYVAARGSARSTIEESIGSIVAYVVQRDSRIVELVAPPGEEHAAQTLVAQVCSDVMERGVGNLRIDDAPGSPWHRWLRDAGGRSFDGARDGGTHILMKLIDRPAFLERLGPMLIDRAAAAGLEFPVELGFLVDGRRRQLTLTRNKATWTDDRLGRSYLELSAEQFDELIWGASSASALIARSATSSTQVGAQVADVLFPQLPHWNPPLDHLPSL